MASPETPLSRLSQLLVPSLTTIINSASWRKPHSKLSHHCKSLISHLPSIAAAAAAAGGGGGDLGPVSSGAAPLSLADSETVLAPLLLALALPATAAAALDCVHKLISHSLLLGPADPSPAAAPSHRLLASLLSAVCSAPADPSLELLTLKTLLSAVTSTALILHGDSLLSAVRTCYDLYLSSRSPVNQTTAKATLVQMLVVVFRRMEADDTTVPVHPVVVAELIDTNTDITTVDSVQTFLTRIITDIDGAINPAAAVPAAATHDGAFESTAVEAVNPEDLLDSTDKDMLDAKYWEINMYKSALEGRKEEIAGDGEEDAEVQIGNKLRRDAFLVFRALCKLSMKTPPKEAMVDPALMRGKILALELLKILLENAGAVFRTSERFLRIACF